VPCGLRLFSVERLERVGERLGALMRGSRSRHPVKLAAERELAGVRSTLLTAQLFAATAAQAGFCAGEAARWQGSPPATLGAWRSPARSAFRGLAGRAGKPAPPGGLFPSSPW